MGAHTGIGWTDSTANPTTGCKGCELWNGDDIRRCYAGNLHEKRLANSLPLLYAPNFQEVRLAPGRMMNAARWPSLLGKDRPGKPWLNGKPRTIFVGDMGDFMSKGVPDEYIVDEIIGAIKSKPGLRHFWFLLTKQPARLAEISNKTGGLPDNSMAMTTVTDQRTANARIPELLKVHCKWRGISAEPLWGELDLTEINIPGSDKTMNVLNRPSVFAPHINWVIAGGESDQDPNIQPKPTHPDWFRSLRDQCARFRVPFFNKQWGAWKELRHDEDGPNMTEVERRSEDFDQWAPLTDGFMSLDGHFITDFRDARPNVHYRGLQRLNKKSAGRLLDGVEHNGYPNI